MMLFYWPLALLGFPPAMILAGIAINTLYQFWIHTELIDRVGAARSASSTPPRTTASTTAPTSQYLDRNHGGILIVWDKLFGTFAPEREPVRYGLTRNIRHLQPAAHRLPRMAGAVARRARAPPPGATASATVFAPPGWSPDGSTLTTRQLQARFTTEVTEDHRGGAMDAVAPL